MSDERDAVVGVAPVIRDLDVELFLGRCLTVGKIRMKSAPARSRFDSLQQEAYLSLWRTYDRLKSLEDDLFAEFDLSAQQYNALRLLEAVHPGTMPTSALGNKLISRAPDMTRLLDRLEERDLVHRERRSENRRVVEVGVTRTGLQLLEKLAVQVRDCHRRQLGHLSEKDLKQLVDLLHSVRVPHEEVGSVWRRED
jgi:DNA-binding MarR family transcriptional regulator